MKKVKKIRVMHVAQAAGGVDRYLQALFKNLNGEIVENILICSNDFEKKDYTNIVSEFKQIDMYREIELLQDLKTVHILRKYIKTYKPDIVYAHSSKAGALTRIANIGLRNKCLYNPHGWAFNMRCSKVKTIMYTFIEKILAVFCNQIICISNAEKQSALNKKICSEKKLKVILNGIDIEEHKKMKEENLVTREMVGIPQKAYVIGMVGRITNQKAPDIFIRVAKKIKDNIPDTYFIIVGDGEQRNEVECFAKKYGFYDSVMITGWVHNPMSYVNLFDVALLLSRWEGFGLVLPEYMLARKPIVATSVDAIPDIITNYENGILTKVDEIDSVCNAVEELYKNPGLREKIIRNGYEVVHRKFDARRVAKEHEVVFTELMKSV